MGLVEPARKNWATETVGSSLLSVGPPGTTKYPSITQPLAGSLTTPLMIETTCSQLQRLGCWRDYSDRAIPTLEGLDSILDGSNYQKRTDAIRKCRDAAANKGFTVFAVQNGGWCASSPNALQTYQKYGPSTACLPDGEGGPGANEVYMILTRTLVLETTCSQLQRLGCWRDTMDRAIPTLEGLDPILDGSNYHARTDAIRKCRDAAADRGYTVFAVQNGGWCASSANALQTYQKYGPSTACLPDGEGGPGANEVYKIVFN
ncbi:uncharacterized protein LOC144919676 [Branchiostoma floridae x Branchiostoma belcheri]